MRRIRDNLVNESLSNAIDAFDNYSCQKHSRGYVMAFEADLLENLEEIVAEIVDESWVPAGYTPKWIFDKKKRLLAKAPIKDHVIESATILPYEKPIYDYSTWRAPAVKPNMGTHGMFRFLRNEMYALPQEEVMYFLPLDAHHYFPRMDHIILKEELARLIKPGKLLRFCYKVVDSYLQGVPLGIKVAQLFGQIYLARFDRLAMRFFDISKDQDKLAYWTDRYVTDRISTAKCPEDYQDLCRGPTYLANKFRRYVREGIPHYFRFVDNILIQHSDKTVLHIIKVITIMTLERDWHVTVNKDYNVKPCWTGIHVCGYTFFHEKVRCGKRNKQELARRIKKLRKRGYEEEEIRVKLASRFGYIKHADSTHLLKTLGMEKSLGKIIKNRRVRPPFKDMTGNQKVKFSSIVSTDKTSDPIKILLEDYKIMDSKIDKEKVHVQMEDSQGNERYVEKAKPNKALAIRFKKILRTFVRNDEEKYIFEKKKDEDGNPTEEDAEFYSFTGSKILIDQAENDFTIEDLPCPTVVQQYMGKNGQTFVKFT